ncbi:sensor histidine kinase [Emticicia sp. W12TSBA100-4]|uniref:sensor histidine kinase n=1 Tax=Emticicia sp. W12TSBA100-4 TaxID=3160965 RepID=UPI003305CDB8
MIERLKKEISILQQQPTSFKNDTLIFRKSDTLFVQESLLNPETQSNNLRLFKTTEQLRTSFKNYNWTQGEYVLTVYQSQIPIVKGKIDSSYYILKDLDSKKGHILAPYEQCWLNINLAEKLLYYKIKNNNQNAFDYLNKALKIAKEHEIWEVIHKVNALKGDYYILIGNYKKALPYFETQSVLFEKHGNRNLGYYSEGANWAHLTICYLHLNMKRKFQHSLKLFKQNNNPAYGGYANYLEHKIYSEISSYNIQQKRFLEALESEKQYQNILLSRSIHDHYNHYYRLYQIYKGLGQLSKAIQAFEKSSELKEKINTQELSKSFKDIEEKYNLEKKESEINELKTIALIKENEKQRYQRNILIFIVILGVVLVFFIFRTLSINRKATELKLSLSNSQNQLVKQVIQTQETERQRLAKDLHDDLGGTLSAIKGKIANEKASQEAINLVEKAIDDLRYISRNLSPPELENDGLIISIKNTIDRIQHVSNINFTFITFGEKQRLHQDIKLNIYRIITELINNILKHSKAQNAIIQLIYYQETLQILVEDDGIGIKSDKNNWGSGLKNINSRVEFLGAKLNIDSSPKGTTVTIEVPKK